MKRLTQAALAAVEIRKILKGQFPGVKFTVRTENYSGGDSIHIGYENFLPTEEIEKYVKGFQYGRFNGMEDIYEYTNCVEGRPQTKYLFVERTITPDVRQATKEKIAKEFGIKDVENEQEWYDKFSFWSDQVVWRDLSKKSFTAMSQTKYV